MAKRSFAVTNWTSGAGVADNSALTTLQYMSLAAPASQLIQVAEIYIGGLAGTTAPQNMEFRRTLTAGTGAASALAAPNSDGPLNTFAAAVTTVPVAAVNYATTQPVPSNTVTQARLNLTFNAFGGIVRWAAIAGYEWWMIGAGANQDSTLSNNTGSTSASVSSHILYEMF